MNTERKKVFERRQELIDKAIEEFSDKGFENASLNNILREVQISKGTFYYHFKNKEELYFYLIEVLIEEKKSFLAEKIQPEDFQKDIFTIFMLQAKLGVEFAKKYPQVNRFSESFIKERGSAIYEKALKRYNFQENDFMAMLIASAYQRGELREDLPKEFVQRVIGYLFTHLVELTDAVKAEDYEEEINNLVEFMREGFVRKG